MTAWDLLLGRSLLPLPEAGWPIPTLPRQGTEVIQRDLPQTLPPSTWRWRWRWWKECSSWCPSSLALASLNASSVLSVLLALFVFLVPVSPVLAFDLVSSFFLFFFSPFYPFYPFYFCVCWLRRRLLSDPDLTPSSASVRHEAWRSVFG